MSVVEEAKLELSLGKHSVTKSMQGAAKKGLEMVDGDQTTVSDQHVKVGRKIASGQKLSSSHVHAVASVHASHECKDKSAECLLMGGASGASWSAARSGAIDSASMGEQDQAISLTDENLSLEVYVRGGIGEEILLGEDGLIWAPILRSGTLAMRPGPNGQKIAEPLVFVPGLSTDSRKEIGLQNLVDAFDASAVQHVTIPTTHDNDVLSNTGYIRGLKIVDSKRVAGQKVLMAAHDFTEPEVKGKIERGSIANRSCGILYDYADTETGTVYPQVLEHVALTNKPWVRGMTAYGEVSEDDFSDRTVVPMLLSEGSTLPTPTASAEPSAEIKNPKRIVISTRFSEDEIKSRLSLADVAWGDAPSLVTIQSALYDHFRRMRTEDQCGAPYYTILDCGVDQALVRVEYGYDSGDGSDAWVVPFTLDGDNKPIVSNFTDWTPVTQEWVADEDAAQDRAELQQAAGTSLSDDARTTDRKNPQPQQGGPMSVPTKDALERLELSDEARDVFQKQDAEIKRMSLQLAEVNKTAKKERVTARVKELQDPKTGGFPPGFCAEYEVIALADDGQVAAVLHLSEGGSVTTIEQTATQIAERLIAALPKDDSGRLALADRATLLENPLTARPALDAAQQAEVEGNGKTPLTAEEWLAEQEKVAPGVTQPLHLSNNGKG